MTNTIQDIIPVANKIIDEYPLCANCLGRLFVNSLHLRSSVVLGSKIFKLLDKSATLSCFICKNIFVDLYKYADMAISESTLYQFSTFVAGTIIKPSIYDRDDLIRSRFNLLGSRAIKTDVTGKISSIFARKTHAKLDSHKPDLIILINLSKQICFVKSTPLFVFGRYTKHHRGIPQSSLDDNIESIQKTINDFLYKKFSNKDSRYVWIGSEDSQSLVSGNGRPFFVKLLNPQKRNIRINSMKNKFIRIQQLHVIPQIPSSPIKFQSTISAIITTNAPISAFKLSALRNLSGSKVSALQKSGMVMKTIHRLSYRRLLGNSIRLLITVDGGFPIQRFIADSDTTPNLSKLLDCKCTCLHFDIKNVKLL